MSILYFKNSTFGAITSLSGRSL